VQNATTFGTVNRGSRKNRGSISGFPARCSHQMNKTASTAEMTKSVTGIVAPKLDVSASMIPNTRVASAPAPSRVPAVSTRAARGSALSGTTTAATSSAASPKNRLNQKMPRQFHTPTMAPPITGPSASASPETPAQTPTARARARSSV
jgi:hypothetical protein